MTLRRGISVLIGGAFERLFCPEGRNLNKPIVKSLNARGEDVEASIWLVHYIRKAQGDINRINSQIQNKVTVVCQLTSFNSDALVHNR